MPQQLIRACYRFASDADRLPPGRVADIRPGPDPDTVTVIVAPGHATQQMLDEIARQQDAMFATGQWYRLESTPENEAHPRRVMDAGWRVMPADLLPRGVIIMSLEQPRRHDWIVRAGEASERLACEMTALLTAMVRSAVYIQRGAGGDTDPNAN